MPTVNKLRMRLQWWGLSPHTPINNGPPMADLDSVLHTLVVATQIKLVSSGCLCVTSLSSLARSVSWSMSFSAQPPSHTIRACIRLGSAASWSHHPSVLVSLFRLPESGCCTRLWASEAPVYPSWSPNCEADSQVEPFSLTAPSQWHRSHPNSFFFF